MALTLRSVAGLTVPEIARAFLSTETAMERRLTRARNKVTDARIPFRVPPDELLPRAAGGRPARDLPRLHRGPRGDAGRPARRGDPARAAARAADARRGRGARAAGAAAADRRALGGACAPAASSSSLADQDRSRWDAARDRRGRRRCSSARCGCRGRLLRDPGRDRRAASIRRRRSRPPTGRRSPASTPSSRATTRRRWWRSTARWRSGSRPGRQAGLAALPGRPAARPLPAAARRPRGAAAPRG